MAAFLSKTVVQKAGRLAGVSAARVSRVVDVRRLCLSLAQLPSKMLLFETDVSLAGLSGCWQAMAIEVVCPNGHKILCPENRAGRAAKCPRCSTPFRIPESQTGQVHDTAMETASQKTVAPVVSTAVTSSDVTTSIATAAADTPTDGMAAVSASGESSLNMIESAEVLAGGSSFKLAGGSDLEGRLSNASKSTGKQSKGSRRPPRDEIVLFLCPNGHKLHGLRELAGKVGQCPHCAAKFEIPFPDLDEQWHEDWEELDDTVTEDPLQDYRNAPIHNLGESDYEPLDEARFGGSQTTGELEGLFEAVRAKLVAAC